MKDVAPVAKPLTWRHWRRRLGQRRSSSGLSPRRHIERSILLSLVVLLAVATGAASVYFSGIASSTTAPQSEPVAAAVPDHRLGAIKYVRVKGPMCEVHHFDNATGQVAPNGSVNCERSAAPEGADMYGQNAARFARLRAFSGAFKR